MLHHTSIVLTSAVDLLFVSDSEEEVEHLDDAEEGEPEEEPEESAHRADEGDLGDLLVAKVVGGIRVADEDRHLKFQVRWNSEWIIRNCI